ncbi:hypothetical protein BE08_37865 [Sorangium cellulosum]|uniref:Uncharacterized protein n=1 Tax=Sorangium cellulosum TaxID=56 RepID=A0A150PRF6_SORCE|nr:hypothetical protein BE08_37865 [Sorangium cellulosum]
MRQNYPGHAEIAKALRAAPSTARTPQAKRIREVMGREVQLCCELTAQLLEMPAEELEAVIRRIGESYFDPGAARLDDPIHGELVRTLPLMSWTDGITDGKKLLVSLHLIAATARGEMLRDVGAGRGTGSGSSAEVVRRDVSRRLVGASYARRSRYVS